MDFPSLTPLKSPVNVQESSGLAGAWGNRSVSVSKTGAGPQAKEALKIENQAIHKSLSIFSNEITTPVTNYLSELAQRRQSAEQEINNFSTSEHFDEQIEQLQREIDNKKEAVKLMGKKFGYRSKEVLAENQLINRLIQNKKKFIEDQKKLFLQHKILKEKNFDLKTVDSQFTRVSPQSIYEAAKEWLGPNPVGVDYTNGARQGGQKGRVLAWRSADGERYFRPPIFKPEQNFYQANFETLPVKTAGVLESYSLNLHIGVAFGVDQNQAWIDQPPTDFDWQSLNSLFK